MDVYFDCSMCGKYLKEIFYSKRIFISIFVGAAYCVVQAFFVKGAMRRKIGFCFNFFDGEKGSKSRWVNSQ